MSNNRVRVVFCDADTGNQIGRSELPLRQLPETFQAETKLELAGAMWSVERAEPPTAAEYGLTRTLALTVRRIESIPAGDILYPLPTLCATVPPVAGAPADVDRFELCEDDWRQVELVSADLADDVQTELRAVRRSYEQHARRDDAGRVYGFCGVHVRDQPIRPLSEVVSRRRLLGLLSSNVDNPGGVGFRGQRGVVPSSFAVAVGRVLVYGLADGDSLAVLALHAGPSPRSAPQPGLVVGLERAMRVANLLLVDWCRAVLVGPASVGDYLAGTGAVGRS